MLQFSSARYLAGTVAIPCTFPTLAKVSRKGEEIIVLDARPLWSVERTICLNEVRAVFISKETCPDAIRRDWQDEKFWCAPRDIVDGTTSMGIIYAHEHAPVLMRVEFGMIAAESAEYYPSVSARAWCPCCEGRRHPDPDKP